MKSRPILFSGPMVRAILEGRKTQTRRLVKPQPPSKFPFAQDGTLGGITAFWWTDKDIDLDDIAWWPGYDDQDAVKCPYGSPGDRLWVRETWGLHSRGDMTDWAARGDDITLERWEVQYRADWGPAQQGCFWRPSIHMPRWASRITLEITGVRVERLQDISEEDPIAEGVNRIAHGRSGYYYSAFNNEYDPKNWCHAGDAYKELWESINGPGSWDANPWVWVIEFKRVKQSK